MNFALGLGFHRKMAYAICLFLVISVAGCALTGIHTSIGFRVISVLTVCAMVLPIPAYWHEKKKYELRDASLTIPWAIAMAAVLSFPLLIAARSDMPLQDGWIARVDGWFGVNVATLCAWARHHEIGSVINSTYPLLTPMLAAAIFAPAFMGRLRSAREFLIANLIAFAIAAPLFALFPAVGPWYHFDFAPTADQAYCQAQLLSLRVHRAYLFNGQGAGVVCFPSFHVIWAILCARALWTFRSVRIPIAVLSSVIILSTMTTGWHYFSDVLAGAMIAAASIWLAARLVRDPVDAYRPACDIA